MKLVARRKEFIRSLSSNFAIYCDILKYKQTYFPSGVSSGCCCYEHASSPAYETENNCKNLS